MSNHRNRISGAYIAAVLVSIVVNIPACHAGDGFDSPTGRQHTLWVFPGGSEVKASAWNEGDLGSIPGSGRSPGEGNGNPPTPVLLPGESHGGRNLVGYSP